MNSPPMYKFAEFLDFSHFGLCLSCLGVDIACINSAPDLDLAQVILFRILLFTGFCVRPGIFFFGWKIWWLNRKMQWFSHAVSHFVPLSLGKLTRFFSFLRYSPEEHMTWKCLITMELNIWIVSVIKLLNMDPHYFLESPTLKFLHENISIVWEFTCADKSTRPILCGVCMF